MTVMERIFNFSIKRLAEVLRWEVACNGRMYVSVQAIYIAP